MRIASNQNTWGTPPTEARFSADGALAARLLAVVDSGLFSLFCLAPFFFGGRHELGRLVVVSIIAVVAVAWFTRQCLLPSAAWTRTNAIGIVLAAIALVGLQLVPLPPDWLNWLSPETSSLLPLWNENATGPQFGAWSTISLTPHETQRSLALLVSYGLLFVVLTQRIQSTGDIEKLLNAVGLAAILMAAFGLIQFFASNGRFFWCIVHPYRSTEYYAMGSFMNRNHFASFLVLGIGPLIRWLLSALNVRSAVTRRRHLSPTPASLIVPGLLLSGILIVILAIALSFSRGGALALFAAGITLTLAYWRWRLIDGKYVYATAVFGLVLLGLLSIYGYEQVTDRLDDFVSGSVDKLDQDEGRRVVWAANLAAIERNWLTGFGAGSHLEVCPAYLSTSTPKEYTHAENGYLQIVTENGVVGALLLIVGLLLCGNWCFRCLRSLENNSHQLCFGAVVAGLAASVTHSLVDFVWYIPACLTVTLALVACLLRLAQMSLPEASRIRVAKPLLRPRWLEYTAAVVCLAVWTIYTFIGPGVAAIHWDRYLRDAVAGAKLYEHQTSPLAPTLSESELAARDPLSQSMQNHLEQTIYWDPSFARAHLRLAVRAVQQFELSQQNAANAMSLSQIREAAQISPFTSSNERREWLDRALGPNAQLLYKAYAHARRAITLSPLQGEAYLYLSELGFLEGEKPQQAAAYLNQALCVRPHNGDVEFEAGKQALLKGDLPAALERWAHCYKSAGAHRARIAGLLAGRIPANVFLETFEPDWHTMRQIWWRYRAARNQDDCQLVAAYAAQLTQRDAQRQTDISPVYMWMSQAEIYQDLAQKAESLKCLEEAYHCDQTVYTVRARLGYALKDAGRLAEAEPHLRWCYSRHPEDKSLNAAILEITKLRATRTEPQRFTPTTISSWQH